MTNGFDTLRDRISSLGKVLVCFSGGLDSTALMHICKETLGDDAIAFYLSTPMESDRTASMVDMISGHLGFQLERRIMDDRISGIVMQNRQNRCYICKKAIYSEAIDLAHEMGIEHVLCGDNSDDDPTDRPGMMAAKELMVLCPFRDCGIGRTDIETYIESLALPFVMIKDTCLLTRVPIGMEADESLLEMIGDIESEIRRATGVEQVRARLSDGIIRIQTHEKDIGTLLAHISELESICRKEGFGTEVLRTGYKG